MNDENVNLPEVEGELVEDLNAAEGTTEPIQLVVVDVVDLDRPFMTTRFTDYTVMEGLLLLLILIIFIQSIVKILKEGFWWL